MNNQSEDRVLGYVGTYPVGDYNEQTEYEYLNVVTHKGSSYVCIKEEGCTAIEPPNEECWQLFAGKGDQGEKGDTGDVGPIGPKPVNGVDYNTEAEQKEFKDKVVADSKTDLEKYIAEKETHLDDYTKEKETELDTYVTDTVKTTIDTYVTDTTKKDIDAYEKEKEKALDTYTDTKKTEIDNYVTDTSKPALDKYEKDKEAELETAKDKAIDEYDAHADSVLTETEDLFNALPTEKASGTELYIEDAKPCRIMNTEIGGMYKQETTKGYQLLDLKDHTVNSNDIISTITKNKIMCTGSSTSVWANITLPSMANFKLEANKTYTIVINKELSYNFWAKINKNIDIKILSGNVSATFISESEITSLYFYIQKTNLQDLSDVNITDLQIIIYEGEYDGAKAFEPFTGNIPSPNFDYPQAIEQVDSLQLQYVGSNLLDYTKILSTSSTTFGITIKLEENGNITISGKLKSSYSPIIQSKNIIDILKDGETYYLDQSNYTRYFYTEIQAIKADGRITYIGPQTTYVSFKVNKSLFKKYVLKIIAGSVSNWGEEERTITSNFKLTRQKNFPFEKYIEKTVNIDLKGNKLCAVSDTIKDKLLIDRNGNVALQKNVGKVIFKGNERWELAEKGFYNSSYFIAKRNKNIFEACCNYFLANKTSRSWTGLNYCGFNASGYFWIQEEHKLATSSGGFNEWLTTHNLEVYYALATPELIDLGQIAELPKTFNGINNIWAETNLGNTEIEIEYVQDVKKLLEKQAEQQNARLDNIENLLSTTETSALLLDNMQNDLESEVK